MGLLNATFGQAGTAQTYFGGEWWIVGLVLITLLLFYFYSRGIPTEGVVLFLFSVIILVTLDNLFTIPNDWIMTFVVFTLMFMSFGLYKLMTK